MSRHDAGPNRRHKPQPGEPNRYETQIEAASDGRRLVVRRIFLKTMLIIPAINGSLTYEGKVNGKED